MIKVTLNMVEDWIEAKKNVGLQSEGNPQAYPCVLIVYNKCEYEFVYMSDFSISDLIYHQAGKIALTKAFHENDFTLRDDAIQALKEKGYTDE